MATLFVWHGTGGRLGNRLMLQAHLMTFCLENPRWRLINFNFLSYAHLFEEHDHHPWMIFPRRETAAASLVRIATPLGIQVAGLHERLPPKWSNRISRHGNRLTYRLLQSRAKLLLWGDGQRCELGSPAFVHWTERLNWILLGGFLFRDWGALERHQESIRHFLRPAHRYDDPARETLNALRARYRTVIGVLVRRTDYAAWLGGRFCFSLPQYRSWLEQLTLLFGPDAGLLLASDDPETANLLEGLPAHLTTGAAGKGGHYMESFAALSRCDVIASPPSTFAAMAAFAGGAPILPLAKAGQVLGVQDLMRRHLFEAARHPEFGCAVQ
jgi:hypothetical protein